MTLFCFSIGLCYCYIIFTDFHYLASQHPAFSPFAMLPPQWLDATYLSYAWPEYFRRPHDLCKLPPPPPGPPLATTAAAKGKS